MKPFLTSVLTALRQLGKGRSPRQPEGVDDAAGKGDIKASRPRDPKNFATLPLPGEDKGTPPSSPPSAP
jgi:hypothetical protein